MQRNTLIALGVFAALAIGVFATRDNKAPQRGIERISFSDVDPEAVTAFEISGPKSAKLAKTDGQWQVESIGKDADASMVDRALEQLAKVSTSDLVTTSAERYEELGVDEAKGVVITAKVGAKTVAKATLGGSASGGSYLRVDDKVFAAKGIYKGTFERDENQWLDKRLFRGRTIDELEKVAVSFGEESFSVIKSEGVWALPEDFKTPDGFRFDKNAARSLASTLINLRAREVVLDEVSETGLSASTESVTLTFAKGESGEAGSVVLTLGGDVAPEEEGKASELVYASVDARADEVVRIATSQAKSIRRGLDALRDLKVMSFETAKATKLAIRDGEKRLQFDKKDGAWNLTSHSEEKPADFDFDPTGVDRRLRAILNARAAKLVTDVAASATGLAAPSATARVTLDDGSSVELAFGSSFKDENEREHFYVKGNADEQIYAAATYLKNTVTGGLDSFKKRAPGGPGGSLGGIDPSALQNLPPDVRKSLEQQMAQQAAQQEMLKKLQAQK